MRASRPFRTSEFNFVVASSGIGCSVAGDSEVVGWEKVVRLAVEHRVLPRVYRNGGCLIPQSVKERMHDHVLRNSRNALSNLLRTVEAVRLVERAGIPVIVLKGPLLAHRLYGDYGLRVCGDVDLLVRSNDLLRAAQALSSAGYRHHTKLDARSLERHRKLEHDVAFAHPDDDTLIELHGNVAQPHYSYRVNLEEWWGARRPAHVAGIEVNVLCREHAYLLSALHAAKHQWTRLDLIADLAAFQSVGLDWEGINVEAASAGITRIIKIGESLARHFYGNADFPDDPLVGQLVTRIVDRKFVGRAQAAWLDIRTRERKQDQIRYLAGRFVNKPLLGLRRRVN